MSVEQEEPKTFFTGVFSDSAGGSCIRICMVAIVAVSAYAIAFDVTTHKGLSNNALWLSLALVAFISGGYAINKTCDPASMLSDTGIGKMLKKVIKPTVVEGEPS